MRSAVVAAVVACTVRSAAAQYTDAQALAFVGAQHWWESGIYLSPDPAHPTVQKHYDGNYCLCDCTATPEGIFCKGGGVHNDLSVVGSFLVTYYQTGYGNGATWEGKAIAYNTSTPFVDTFTQNAPGGTANYTGFRSDNKDGFLWRGYMTGATCEWREKCDAFCLSKNYSTQYSTWSKSCFR